MYKVIYNLRSSETAVDWMILLKYDSVEVETLLRQLSCGFLLSVVRVYRFTVYYVKANVVFQRVYIVIGID